MLAHHDDEWGVPSHDERHLFEVLTLEAAQAGLSWATILRKREGYREAFAGFPMELLAGGGVNPKAPVPQVQLGHITAVTDYFLLPGDPTERNLVQHQLPATGGASGSPVVDSSGQVVAVLSGGNVVMLNKTLRLPIGAGVNFAQRSSLVRELLEVVDPV